MVPMESPVSEMAAQMAVPIAEGSVSAVVAVPMEARMVELTGAPMVVPMEVLTAARMVAQMAVQMVELTAALTVVQTAVPAGKA